MKTEGGKTRGRKRPTCNRRRGGELTIEGILCEAMPLKGAKNPRSEAWRVVRGQRRKPRLLAERFTF